MIRKAKRYKIREVLSQVIINNKHARINFDGDLIKMNSLRLQVFKQCGVHCVRCGLSASYFYKEKFKRDDNFYHFNLYGVNDKGVEILFTKDHIIPKSKGGADYIKNLQTMCYDCNQKKGDKL